MARKLSFDCIEAVAQLAMEKYEYERQAEAYKRPEGIAGLFSRPPRDPYPEVTMSDARVLVSQAGRGVYPMLNTTAPANGDPAGNRISFELDFDEKGSLRGSYHERSPRYIHDEYYEQHPGYGLQFGYSHSTDSEQNARNRNYATQKFLDGRLPDTFFKKAQDVLDNVRKTFRDIQSNDYQKPIPMKWKFSHSEVMGHVKEIRAYAAEVRREEEIREAGIKHRIETEPVTSFRGYLDAYAQMQFIAGNAVRRGGSNEKEIETFKALERSSNSYANHVHNTVGTEPRIYFELNNETKHIIEPKSMMDFARRSFELLHVADSHAAENIPAFYMTFASLARQNGMSRDEIFNRVNEDAATFGIGEFNGASRNKFIEIQRSVGKSIDAADEMRLHAVREVVSEFAKEAVTRGDETIGPVPLHKAYAALNGRLPNAIRDVQDVEAGQAFLRSMEREGRKIDNVESVSLAMYQWGAKVEPREVAAALIVNAGHGLSDDAVRYKSYDLQRGIDKAYADDFEKTIEKMKGVEEIRKAGLSGGFGSKSLSGDDELKSGVDTTKHVDTMSKEDNKAAERKETFKNHGDEVSQAPARPAGDQPNEYTVSGVIRDIRTKPGNVPVAVLAEDLAAAAFTMREKNPKEFGAFLREYDIRMVGGSASLSDSFRYAASKMFGKGEAANSKRIADFRETYAAQIAEGKQKAPRFQPSKTMGKKFEVKM